MGKELANADEVYRDLSILSKAMEVQHVRLVGGEPTMHPDLSGIVTAVRESGISKRIRLITNGLLLERASRHLWELVDDIHISCYPGFEPTTKALEYFRQMSHAHGVSLELKYFDFFREPYVEGEASATDITERVYRTCKMAHDWDCHNVYKGHFFKCPQSIFLRRLFQADPFSDGISIEDSLLFKTRLADYLLNPKPLRACSNCLGSVGKLFRHEQVDRSAWREVQRQSLRNVIDFEYLTLLEGEHKEVSNLCVRDEWEDPANEILINSYKHASNAPI